LKGEILKAVSDGKWPLPAGNTHRQSKITLRTDGPMKGFRQYAVGSFD
jgi:hypothetical protein